MKILEPRSQHGWVTAVIAGRWVQAKVYDKPSMFGINNGRVSKCAIGKTDKINPSQDYEEQIDFSYDRGTNFNNLPAGVLDVILAELETLQNDS